MRPKRKLLFLKSELKGGRVFNHWIEKHLNSLRDEIDVTTVVYCSNASESYRCRFPYNLGDTLRVYFFVRELLRQNKINFEEYDELFLTSHLFLLPCASAIKKKRCFVRLDATPKRTHRGLNLQDCSLSNQLRAKMSSLINSVLLSSAYKSVDVFLPITSNVKESLITDYGVEEDKIHILRPYLEPGKVPREFSSPKLKLLFVGHDFIRKGGEFLVDLFKNHLSESFELTVVSDPTAAQYLKGTSIKLLTGLQSNQVRDLMKQSDIFIFPTRFEAAGIVLFESLSTGLPVIAADAGGQDDMVKDGFNGYLLPYNASAKDWAEKLIELDKDRNKLKEFAKNSINLAKETLGEKRFKDTLLNVILK